MGWVKHGLLVLVAGITLGCGEPASKTPTEAARGLLAVHGMLGRTPRQRSDDQKNERVQRDVLERYIADLDKFDEFTADLYTGVVLGALATHQGTWHEQVTGRSGSIKSGEATIWFVQGADGWKVSLNKTIPQKMKARAKAEKARYEAARAAGRALSGNK